MRKRFGKNDAVFLSVLVLMVLLCWAFFEFAHNNRGDSIVITVDGRIYGSYSLAEEQTIEVTDAEGKVTNIVRIEEGRAGMIEASCPDLLCVHQRKIDCDKQTIVCLPNRVVVTVCAEEEAEIDAVAN